MRVDDRWVRRSQENLLKKIIVCGFTRDNVTRVLAYCRVVGSLFFLCNCFHGFEFGANQGIRSFSCGTGGLRTVYLSRQLQLMDCPLGKVAFERFTVEIRIERAI